ncbi:MAG TPA: PEGA domain-containing protein, partial [Vicinamibacteria bacterium]
MLDLLARPHGVAALALGLLLSAIPARAQDWDETYRAGLTALARGDNARAAESFRRAIAMRPEPGRNIPTYGTNVEARYFPYLRLAEACLALGQLEAARDALERSASWGTREPADERQKLMTRLEAAMAQRRPAPPSPPPVTATPVVSPTAPPIVAEPAPAATPAAVPSVTAPPRSAPPISREPFHPGHVDEREPRPPAEPPRGSRGAVAPAADAATGTLEIISQPPGATAYVDDEPVGATDPQTGRLVKTGLAPGRHHVRLTRAGFEDVVADLDVAAGGAAVFRAT